MSGGLGAIQERRARLVQRAALERDELTHQLQIWRERLTVVDRGMALFRSLKRRVPLIRVVLGVGAVALVVARPIRLLPWAWGGLKVARLVRRLF